MHCSMLHARYQILCIVACCMHGIISVIQVHHTVCDSPYICEASTQSVPPLASAHLLTLVTHILTWQELATCIASTIASSAMPREVRCT
jgi:hypothetical protein